MHAAEARVWKQRLVGAKGGHGVNEVGGGGDLPACDEAFQLVNLVTSIDDLLKHELYTTK